MGTSPTWALSTTICLCLLASASHGQSKWIAHHPYDSKEYRIAHRYFDKIVPQYRKATGVQRSVWVHRTTAVKVSKKGNLGFELFVPNHDRYWTVFVDPRRERIVTVKPGRGPRMPERMLPMAVRAFGRFLERKGASDWVRPSVARSGIADAGILTPKGKLVFNARAGRRAFKIYVDQNRKKVVTIRDVTGQR